MYITVESQWLKQDVISLQSLVSSIKHSIYSLLSASLKENRKQANKTQQHFFFPAVIKCFWNVWSQKKFWFEKQPSIH